MICNAKIVATSWVTFSQDPLLEPPKKGSAFYQSFEVIQLEEPKNVKMKDPSEFISNLLKAKEKPAPTPTPVSEPPPQPAAPAQPTVTKIIKQIVKVVDTTEINRLQVHSNVYFQV